MKIFKYKTFSEWAKEEEINDEVLIKAITEIKKGLFEANLGSGLYKKRVARKGQGKRGSFRTLIAFRQNEKAIFMFGFSKNERKNISDKEKEVFKKLAKHFLETTKSQLESLIRNGELQEIK